MEVDLESRLYEEKWFLIAKLAEDVKTKTFFL